MLSSLPDWLLISLPAAVGAVFAFAFGACVGSFLNVLAYRLPLGMSVVSPPSRCPGCGWRLRWHENLPVLGWFLLDGRCSGCRGRISIQYPLIEAVMGVLLAALYLALYSLDADDRLGGIGRGWWHAQGFIHSSPSFVALGAMASMLVGATLIDARTFTIPISLTAWASVVAMVGWTVQGLIPAPASAGAWPIATVGWGGIGAGVGGVLGIGVSEILVRLGFLCPSFADYCDYLKDGEPLAEYPHARREMGREVAYVLPMLALGSIGALALGGLEGTPPMPLKALGASLIGFLVGGGLIWATRMAGTLAVGREAMGMGDVHLLAAVGAALGWMGATAAYFLAPFVALSWILVGKYLLPVNPGRRELPYGPHLAAAALLVVFARPALADFWRVLVSGGSPVALGGQ